MNRVWVSAHIARQRKILLSTEDFKGLLGPIILNQFEGRAFDPMSFQELKQVFPELTAVSYAPSGNQILHVGDKLLEVGPMASNDEIRLALANPAVRTENTKVTIKMQKPWQGLAQKVGKMVHDAELHASKISARVDAVGPRMENAAAKVNAVLDGHEKDVADVESFAAEMEKLTNGG